MLGFTNLSLVAKLVKYPIKMKKRRFQTQSEEKKASSWLNLKQEKIFYGLYPFQKSKKRTERAHVFSFNTFVMTSFSLILSTFTLTLEKIEKMRFDL